MISTFSDLLEATPVAQYEYLRPYVVAAMHNRGFKTWPEAIMAVQDGLRAAMESLDGAKDE